MRRLLTTHLLYEWDCVPMTVTMIGLHLNCKKGELDDKQYTEAQLYRNCNCHKYQIHNPHICIAIYTFT